MLISSNERFNAPCPYDAWYDEKSEKEEKWVNEHGASENKTVDISDMIQMPLEMRMEWIWSGQVEYIPSLKQIFSFALPYIDGLDLIMCSTHESIPPSSGDVRTIQNDRSCR